MTEEEVKAAQAKAQEAKAKAQTPDEVAAAQHAAALKSSQDLHAATSKATAEGKILITDFAGTVGGVFSVQGVNLDKGDQLTIDGQVPAVTTRKPHVIKGKLVAPGFHLKSGPVTVKLGDATFKGTL